MNRALRVARPALTIVVALAVAIAAVTAASGGASALLVARAAVQVVLTLAVAGVLGALVVARQQDEASRGRLLDAAATAAAVWTVAAALTAFLLYLEQAPALDSPAFGPGLVTFVFDVEVGRDWLVGAGLAAVLTALLVGIRSRRGVAGLVVAAVVAAVPVALQSALSGDAIAVERSVDSAGLVQLVGLGAWLGALAVSSSRRTPLLAFGGVVLGVGAAAPALLAEGAITPLGVAGAGAVVLAGLVAVAAAARRVDLRTPQLVLLAAATGLGIAGSVTRTAAEVPARSTPAEILSGAPLPAPPSIAGLAGSWQPDAVWLVLGAALLVGYAVAVARRPERRSLPRAVFWVLGVVLLGWLTCGGPAVYQTVLVVPWFAQHAALLLVVPLLLAGGAPLRLVADDRTTVLPRMLARPVTALVVVAAAALLLAGTGLLRWSAADPVGTEVSIALCLLAGGLLVHAVAAPGPARTSAIVVAVVLLIAETAAALALASGSALLAADWYGAMGWGTDALAAQRSAALVVWSLTAVPTLALLVAAIRAPGVTSASLDRRSAVTA